MSILGIDTINITASTTSTWGNTRLRVALVLDNTGSMAQSGQDDRAEDRVAKSSHAAHRPRSSRPDDVYVSIIPFVNDVNRRIQPTTAHHGSTGQTGTQ